MTDQGHPAAHRRHGHTSAPPRAERFLDALNLSSFSSAAAAPAEGNVGAGAASVGWKWTRRLRKRRASSDKIRCRWPDEAVKAEMPARSRRGSPHVNASDVARDRYGQTSMLDQFGVRTGEIHDACWGAIADIVNTTPTTTTDVVETFALSVLRPDSVPAARRPYTPPWLDGRRGCRRSSKATVDNYQVFSPYNMVNDEWASHSIWLFRFGDLDTDPS